MSNEPKLELALEKLVELCKKILDEETEETPSQDSESKTFGFCRYCLFCGVSGLMVIAAQRD
jgi:hypothetical protein